MISMPPSPVRVTRPAPAEITVTIDATSAFSKYAYTMTLPRASPARAQRIAVFVPSDSRESTSSRGAPLAARSYRPSSVARIESGSDSMRVVRSTLPRIRKLTSCRPSQPSSASTGAGAPITSHARVAESLPARNAFRVTPAAIR